MNDFLLGCTRICSVLFDVGGSRVFFSGVDSWPSQVEAAGRSAPHPEENECQRDLEVFFWPSGSWRLRVLKPRNHTCAEKMALWPCRQRRQGPHICRVGLPPPRALGFGGCRPLDPPLNPTWGVGLRGGSGGPVAQTREAWGAGAPQEASPHLNLAPL